MGLRFRRSVKIAPGIKVNFGKKSTGISVGGKYGGISFNSKTGAHMRASAPGTGLSYTTKVGTTEHIPNSTVTSTADTSSRPPFSDPPKRNKHNIIWWCIAGFMALSAFSFFPSVSSVLFAIIAICALPIAGVKNFLETKLHLEGKIKVLVIILAFFAAVIMSPTDTNQSDLPSDNSVVTESTDKTPNGSVTNDEKSSSTSPAPNNNATKNAESSLQDPKAENGSSSPTETPSQKNETNEKTATDTNQQTPIIAPVPQQQTQPQQPSSQAPATNTEPNDHTVYITPTGKRYHYDPNCGNGTYIESTLSQAKNNGLTPCKKCAGG